MMIIDEKYLDEVLRVFGFAERTSFTQIATVAKLADTCMPKLRTVLLYYLEQRKALRFSCSNQTHKWLELKQTPKVTGLYFDAPNRKQYRFEAHAQLVDQNNPEEKELHQETWVMTRQDLKHVLWQEYLGDKNVSYNVNEICPLHGTVLLFPYYWDIFKLGVNDFSQSQRTQMVLEDNRWLVFENTPNIHPLGLKR